VSRLRPLPPELLLPHPDRLPPGDSCYDEIVAAHADAVHQGRGRYQDPDSGLWVMTARALWERGFCCDLGCRHCPYVPRP
jgi:hypothetical protein